MNLLRIKLISGDGLGALQGLEQFFGIEGEDPTPLCFIGANGTGKSRLLQCLAEIFETVDSRFREFRPVSQATLSYTFELEYEISSSQGRRRILIKSFDPKKPPEVWEIDGDENQTPVPDGEVLAVLPAKVIGYTSGQNETLSFPFLNVRAEYATEVRQRALDRRKPSGNIPDLRLAMMDYDLNLSILTANMLLQPAERLARFEEFARIDGLDSFRIVFQTNHRAARKKVKIKVLDAGGNDAEEERSGVQLVEELESYVDALKRCSTSWDYSPEEKRFTFDFLVSDATKDAFAYFFKSAQGLFGAFQRLEMLNELMVPKQHRTHVNDLRRRSGILYKLPSPVEVDKVFRYEAVKVNLSEPRVSTDYIRLSDGQHQFVHVFGTMLMFDDPNILFLLDEAESHFNPQWRIRFMKTLDEMRGSCPKAVILTTHAPFVISDLPSDRVFVFRLTEGASSLSVQNPAIETFGATFDGLMEDVFDVKPPVSGKSLSELRELQSSESLATIESRLDDFGDSPEKFYLFQRVEELRNRS